MPDPERFFDHRQAQRFTRAELSMLDGKAAAYAAEPAYRETLYELARRCDGEEELGRRLRARAIGLFRPDAIAHGKAVAALAYLSGIGVRPVAALPVPVSAQTVREIWRYQLNLASGQRLRLLDLLFGASDSVLAFFESDPDTPGLPCTVLMADAKGPATPAERQGWELRARLGSPNRVEVYLHCADEPADVVRDGGLLLGSAGFAEAFFGARDPDAAQVIAALAGELAEAARAGSKVEVDPLLQRSLGPPAGPVDRWELLRSAAAGCAMAAGEGDTLISDSGIHRWWELAGLLEQRHGYFAGRTGWRGGELTAPLP